MQNPLGIPYQPLILGPFFGTKGANSYPVPQVRSATNKENKFTPKTNAVLWEPNLTPKRGYWKMRGTMVKTENRDRIKAIVPYRNFPFKKEVRLK